MIAVFNSVKCVLLVLLGVLTFGGCTSDFDLNLPDETQSLKFDKAEVSARPGTQLHFHTSLKGANEVPTPQITNAVGQVTVKITKDESKIHYKITVGNIENVTAAHFHFAKGGVNGFGAPVAPLYSNPAQPSGPDDGVLAEGDIMAGDVINAFAGDLVALIDAMRAGNIYVNVHTQQVPGRLIRGQL